MDDQFANMAFLPSSSLMDNIYPFFFLDSDLNTTTVSCICYLLIDFLYLIVSEDDMQALV